MIPPGRSTTEESRRRRAPSSAPDDDRTSRSATVTRIDDRRGDRSLREPVRFPPVLSSPLVVCDDGNRPSIRGDLSPMLQRATPPPRQHRHAVAGVVAAVALGSLALVACGGGDTASTASTQPLSAAAERGRQTALDAGCASCHGANWQGGVAPAWVGLAGSTVTLSDGTTVTADADYLARSITAPADEKVRGFSVAMPPNALTADQVADVVAFIQALTPSEDA